MHMSRCRAFTKHLNARQRKIIVITFMTIHARYPFLEIGVSKFTQIHLRARYLEWMKMDEDQHVTGARLREE